MRFILFFSIVLSGSLQGMSNLRHVLNKSGLCVRSLSIQASGSAFEELCKRTEEVVQARHSASSGWNPGHEKEVLASLKESSEWAAVRSPLEDDFLKIIVRRIVQGQHGNFGFKETRMASPQELLERHRAALKRFESDEWRSR